MARFDDIEQFWSAILSEDADAVLAAWRTLDAEERRDCEAHLRKMSDPAHGFADVQQRSAHFALDTIVAQKS
jgi:hypothetical protein